MRIMPMIPRWDFGDLDGMVEESLGSLLKTESHVWDDEDLVTEKHMVIILLETHISPFKGTFESMIFLFLRWVNVIVPWRIQ